MHTTSTNDGHEPGRDDASGEWTRERYAALLQQRRTRGLPLPAAEEDGPPALDPSAD